MLHERILRASIAAVIEGRMTDVRIKCNKRQKSVLEYSVIATKNLQNVLKSNETTLDEVLNAMTEYKIASDQFLIAFNVSWPM